MENTELQDTHPDFKKKVELISTEPKLYSRKPKTVEAILYSATTQELIEDFLGDKFVKFAWVDKDNGEPLELDAVRSDSVLAVFFKMPMGQREDIEVSAIIEEDVLVKDENGVVVPMHWTEFVEEFEEGSHITRIRKAVEKAKAELEDTPEMPKPSGFPEVTNANDVEIANISRAKAYKG